MNLSDDIREKLDKKKLEVIRHIDEDDDTLTIVFEKPQEVREHRAEPDELTEGDFVSWKAGDGRNFGQIDEIATEGVIVSDTGFEMRGTPEDPVALILIYEDEDGQMVRRIPELRVVHQFSTLEKEDPARFDSRAYKYEVMDRTEKNNIERRTYPVTVEYRAEGDGKQPVISGYAVVFNSRSENLGGFVEEIDSRAFDSADITDVRALFNHDPNFILGRTTNNTLTLTVDERGLKYEIKPPNTRTINDLVLEPIKRGDVSQSSFGFTISEDEWEDGDEGTPVRTITRVHTLYDVSPVTFPAYRATDATARSLEDYKAEREEDMEEELEDTPKTSLSERQKEMKLKAHKYKLKLDAGERSGK